MRRLLHIPRHDVRQRLRLEVVRQARSRIPPRRIARSGVSQAPERNNRRKSSHRNIHAPAAGQNVAKGPALLPRAAASPTETKERPARPPATTRRARTQPPVPSVWHGRRARILSAQHACDAKTPGALAWSSRTTPASGADDRPRPHMSGGQRRETHGAGRTPWSPISPPI